MTCTATDSLGNSLVKSWNASFNSNDINITTTLINSFQNVTKLGYDNFDLSVSSEHDIISVDICIESAPCTNYSNIPNLVSITLPNDGFYNVTFIGKNILGYSKEVSNYAYFDGSVPVIEFANDSTHIYDSNNNTLIISDYSNLISFDYSDTGCQYGNVFSITNGQIINSGIHSNSFELTNGVGNVTIQITDCVGWTNVSVFEVQHKNNIGNFSQFNFTESHVNQNGELTVRTNGSFTIQSVDLLNLELSCQTSIGTITCDKSTFNTWEIHLQNVYTSGIIYLTFEDPIGNSYTMSYTLIQDDAPPECEISGVISDQVLYVRSLNNIQFTCQDNTSELRNITVVEGLISKTSNSDVLEYNVSLNNSFINLIATDNVGNTLYQSYIVYHDIFAPVISCTSESLNDTFDSVLYSSFGDIISCIVIDDVPTSGNFTLSTYPDFVNEQNGTYNDNFIINLPSYSHDSELRLNVYAEDTFGNINQLSYQIIIDQIKPFIEVNSYTNDGYIVQENTVSSNGVLMVNITDPNYHKAVVEIVCSTGQNYNFVTQDSSFNALNGLSDFNSCGNYFQFDVVVIDLASNSEIFNQIYKIDYETPEIIISSSCPIDVSIQNLLVYDCVLGFYATDDSTDLPKIDVFVHDNLTQTGYGSINIDLSMFEESISYEIKAVVRDSVNKIDITQFTFYINENISGMISASLCLSENLSCNKDQYYGYDYLFSGSVTLDLEIIDDYYDVNLENKSAGLCPISQTVPCINLSELPITLDTLQEGYWELEYQLLDEYGRFTSGNYTILVDNGNSTLAGTIVYPESALLSDDSVLVCETCNLKLEVVSGHMPKIKSNNNLVSISQSNQDTNIWEIFVPMQEEYLPVTQELTLSIEFAGGKEIYLNKSLRLTGNFGFNPFVNGSSPCYDDTAELQQAMGESIDFMCFFDHEDINQMSNLLTF